MPASTRVTRELRSIRMLLRQLQRSFDRLAPALATAASATSGPRQRRKLRLTPARRAALKLQGQYMGTLRGLSPREKSKVKKVRAAKGLRAAIAAAQKLAA